MRRNRNEYRLESLEGRNLMSALTPGSARPVAQIHTLNIKLQSSVAQYGSASAAPGKSASVTVILGTVSRTGAVSPLSGIVKVYRGSTLVGSVNCGGVIATGNGNIYGKGIFTFAVPSNAARGSAIQLTLKFEGGSLNYPAQGTATVSVR